MRTALILTLILLPLVVFCQKVDINYVNETVTLDKQKTIDVAKIIQNEKRLQSRVEELEGLISSLNDSIQLYTKNYNYAVSRVEELFNEVVSKGSKVNELTEEQLKLEKKLRKYGLYSYSSVGGNIEALNALDFGLAYANRKNIFTFTLDPFLYKKISWKIGFGLKLF